MIVHQLVVTERGGSGVSAFVIAAIAMLVAVIPCGIVICARARSWKPWWRTRPSAPSSSSCSSCWPRVSGRSGEFELPVLLAVLILGSGLVFVRFLERWL